jgi:hypothetical protein
MAAQRGIGLIFLALRFLAMTFGLSLKVNLVGVGGIVLAAVTLRRL